MLKVKRLEEINTCYNSNELEKMAFFHCMEKVEKVKCFLEESSSEQDTRSGKNEAKEKSWSQLGLKETAPVKDKRTSALTDDVPAPPAPFNHRIVTAKQAAINSFYTVSRTEILGGGRFGQVHKCEEKATGLKLAAKIIKTRSTRDKDEVKNEINIMNQLDHVNLIQLYDAFESKNDIVLVMEYVDGGELFDRIIDDNYNLTEFDSILFIKQICEGIRHMHQMYILHLDLKVKHAVWNEAPSTLPSCRSVGPIRYYLPAWEIYAVMRLTLVPLSYRLSGLSPFLGDNDAETLSNILACRWDLEDEEFQDISEEAREFISKLLIKEKSWRISASEALKHPWLSDHKLHSRLITQKNCCSNEKNLVTK
uniref:Myosin light chain kinase family member 4 n=1 Tax=Neovison vison TaxID=452646 RepID=A0A8C7EPU8_NEOVI